MTLSLEEAQRVVAETRELFGRPGGLTEQQEAHYYRIMTAFAMDVAPKSHVEKMLLNELTADEFDKSVVRSAKNTVVQKTADQYQLHALRPPGTPAGAGTILAPDNSDGSDAPGAGTDQPIAASGVASVAAAADADARNVAYAHAVTVHLETIVTTEDLISTKMGRQADCLRLLTWYRAMFDAAAAPAQATTESRPQVPLLASQQAPSIAPDCPAVELRTAHGEPST